MPKNENTINLAFRAALSLCVEELDRVAPDWREGLEGKSQFAAHDGVVRYGELDRVNDADEMEKIAKMIRRILIRSEPRKKLSQGIPPCTP